AAAVNAAKSIDYVGAGTIEFLLDKSGAFYFLEMNTRLQVEHPVTEMVTGLDLVAMQIRVAEGATLPLTQAQVQLQGSAIEVRLYAEDPAKGFLPCTGHIEYFTPHKGEGVRFDTGVESGQDISPFYDPMIAKLITYGDTRTTARLKMVEALRETSLFGLTTNRDFLIACMENENFAAGDFSTAFIAEVFGDSATPTPITPRDIAALAVRHFQFDNARAVSAALAIPKGLLNFTTGEVLTTPYRLEIGGNVFNDVPNDVFNLQVSTRAPHIYQVAVGEDVYEIHTPAPNSTPRDDVRQTLHIDNQAITTHALLVGDILYASIEGRTITCSNLLSRVRVYEEAGDGRTILAPMHGRVVSVAAQVGAQVAEGECLAIVEAMKMQHEIIAQASGKVAEVLVVADAQVGAGDLMIKLEEDS
ncbi:MAG: 3-methylcrotonyl-CoA carboxylase, partial [Alphaproteobacteria bacterium]|nr:3-methylcrotonyl-CoA carboxylase [Alphaproteobacteria bacterium]